jgi:2'-phosphotransferase
MEGELAERFEEQASLQGKGKNRGGGRGGKAKGGGGPPREVAVSKALSRLLRHQAENAGIKLDREGYAPVDRVVSRLP